MGQVSPRSIRERDGEQAVIRGRDLDVHGDERLVFVAPSGGGKPFTPCLTTRPKSCSAGKGLIDGVHGKDWRPQGAQRSQGIPKTLATHPHDQKAFASLDESLQVHTCIELARRHEDLHATEVSFTHEQNKALTLSDRVAVFNPGVRAQLAALIDLPAWPTSSRIAFGVRPAST